VNENFGFRVLSEKAFGLGEFQFQFCCGFVCFGSSFFWSSFFLWLLLLLLLFIYIHFILFLTV